MYFLLALIIAAIVGGIVGREIFVKRNIKLKGYGTIQSITVFILVFFMGTKIGSDERILDSIKDIGISSVVVTAATMIGSVLAVFLLRKFLKMNKEGNRKND